MLVPVSGVQLRRYQTCHTSSPSVMMRVAAIRCGPGATIAALASLIGSTCLSDFLFVKLVAH